MALAYLAWPIALLDRIAPREAASSWYRGQMHQARWFGGAALAIAAAAILWPFLLSAVVPNTTAIIAFYILALAIDLVLLVVWLVAALRYSRRAAHGEWFEIPWLRRSRGRSGPPL